MNRLQLVTAVKGRLGITTVGDPMWPDTYIVDTVNEALVRISAEKKWPWLLTSSTLNYAAGVSTAAIPTGYTRPKMLLVQDAAGAETTANEVSLDDMFDQSSTGMTRWCVDGTNIRISPTPTVALVCRLYYYRVEPELTVDGSTPLLPSAWHPAIVARAAHLASLRKSDTKMQGVFDMDASRLVDVIDRSLTPGGRRVVRQSAYGGI